MLNTKGVEMGLFRLCWKNMVETANSSVVPERLAWEVSLTLKSISFKLVMEAEKSLIEDC